MVALCGIDYSSLLPSFLVQLLLLLLQLCALLQLHPRKRISANAAMQHRYFADLPYQLFELQDGECELVW